MNREQIKNKVDNAVNKADNWAEEKAEKHNFTKTQVFVGVAIAVLALIGIAYLVF